MKRGISLFEVMIITGLLGLLIVVLSPALFDAKNAALDAKCKSNLRSLAIMAQTYAMNEGYFPWGSIDPQSHDEEYAKIYAGGLMIYPRERPSLHGINSWREYQTFCWDYKKKAGDQFHTPGDMFPRGTTTLQGCPCCRDSDNWDGMRITGYNYNVCYLGYVEGDAGIRNYPRRWDSIDRPERIVIFGDGGYSGGANKFMRAPKQDKAFDGSSSSLRKAGTQAFRHGVGHKRHCNMAFVDGHVESFYKPYKTNGKEGWVDEDTHTAFISKDNGIYGGTWEDEESY